MIRRLVTVLVVSTLLSGCATSHRAPLQISRSIAVLPANNRTGDPLLVTGAGLIDRYVRHAAEVSVGDVLQSEARYQLQQKGFEVREWKSQGTAREGVPTSLDSALALARQNGIANSVLYLEIRRWEADAPTHTRYVIVAMTASLLDPVSGREIWHEQRNAAPVGTPGVITVESAYVVAARKIIADMLARLKPEPPAK
jgi:ABC-type uncharacterized transport system auxiliary subunit